MKYCAFCGKSLEDHETCSCPSAVAQAAATKRKKTILFAGIGGGAVAIVIAVIIIVASSFSASVVSSKVDPFDYFEISFMGYNGNGTIAGPGLDYDALIDDILDDELDEFTDFVLWMEQYEIYAENIFVSYSKEAGLSNGDEITVTISVTGTARDKIKSGSKTIPVTNLPEYKEVDFLGDIKVTFEGFNGVGTAILDVPYDNELVRYFSFALSNDSNLSNGDVINLVVSANEAQLSELGYFLPQETFSYTVSGLVDYFDISSGFPDEELENLCQLALSATKDKEAHDDDIGFNITSESALCGAYFLTAKDPTQPFTGFWGDKRVVNGAVIVTRYAWNFWGTDRVVWILHIYPNYYADASGHLAYDSNAVYYEALSDLSLEEIEEWFATEYACMDLTKLDLPQSVWEDPQK